MKPGSWRNTARNVALLASLCLGGLGCYSGPQMGRGQMPAATIDAPRELNKQALPSYQIEPPDVLLIQVVRWSVDEKTGEILKMKPANQLLPQAIDGPHLVRPDGTIGLGVYGSVQMAGLTLDQGRDNIKGFLGQWFGQSPEAFAVIVDVAAYNSKSYYVITDGGGYGEQVFRFPVTGNETVLDAISQIQGLPAVASKRDIWVARRGPNCGPEQVMCVDWICITQFGDTRTNYQIMPGDRIYVMAQRIIRADSILAKMFAPVERLFGIVLLGSETVNSIKGIR